LSERKANREAIEIAATRHGYGQSRAYEMVKVDSGLDAPVKLEVSTNADEVALGGPTPALRSHALYSLDVGQTMTIVIED
jgi:hypothetical protein